MCNKIFSSKSENDQISTSIFGTSSQISSKTTELKSSSSKTKNVQRRPTTYLPDEEPTPVVPRPSVRAKRKFIGLMEL